MKNFHALAVVFTGSFLLFGIQPMLGGTLLPSFGGSAAVWTVCLAAYQTLLFVGYLYAHLISKKPLRTQRVAHLTLLLFAVLWTAAFVFVLPHLRSLIGAGSSPALHVIFSVLLISGLPYVLLSAGSTLVQVWVSKTRSDSPDGVYKLYAVSNLGSFAGLFAYPLLFEPFISLRMQWLGFAVMLGIYTVLLARQIPTDRSAESAKTGSVSSESSPPAKHRVLWFFLPACSVFLLNALTAHITLDIMPLPLVWAVLLALFLLSYVVGFSGMHSKGFLPLPFIAAGFAIFSALMSKRFEEGTFIWNLIATLGLCFFGPLFLHHWLYQLRPKTRHLTLYYLGNAAGGAIGGLSASLLAPCLFKTVAEYPIALFLLGVALLAYAGAGIPRKKMLAAAVLAAAAVAFVAAGFVWMPQKTARPVIWRDRGFFGTLRVTELPARSGQETGFIREFFHGNTVHGIQATTPSKRRTPTSYFTADAGGVAILQHPKYKQGEPMRVALVGLGMGVMSAYGRTNDFYRGYEISPEVLSIATNPAVFSFLADSPANIDIVFGDARKALEAERTAREPRYDVICLDTFTGDNIPRHHSTREAFQLYFDRLAPDGILAVNISNRYLDLTPLIKAVGIAFACPVLVIHQSDDLANLRLGSDWAFFIKTPPSGFSIPPGASILDFNRVYAFKLPTDEKGSFISLIQWPWRK
ncbi:MAG: fused MFS/spermidine synthase [Kiritimatiellales bacterium]